MADNIIKLRAEFEGAETLRDLEKLRRTVNDARKDAILGSADYLKAARLEKEIKNEIHALNTRAYSDNAKMKESYFSLGQQLRKFYMEQRVQDRTMNEAAQVLNMYNVNVTSVVSSLQTAEFSLTAVGLASQKAGGGIAAMGASLAAMAAPLSIAVGSTGLLVKDIFDIAENIGKLRQELASLSGNPAALIATGQSMTAGAASPSFFENLLGMAGGGGAFPLLDVWIGLKKEELGLEREITGEKGKQMAAQGKLMLAELGGYGPRTPVTEYAWSQENEKRRKAAADARTKINAGLFEGRFVGPSRVLGGFDTAEEQRDWELQQYMNQYAAKRPYGPTREEAGMSNEVRKLSEFQSRAYNLATNFKAIWTDALIAPIQTGSQLLDQMIGSVMDELLDFLFTLGLDALTHGGFSAIKKAVSGTKGKPIRQYGGGLGVQERLVGVVSGRNLRLIMIRENQVHNIAVI